MRRFTTPRRRTALTVTTTAAFVLGTVGVGAGVSSANPEQLVPGNNWTCEVTDLDLETATAVGVGCLPASGQPASTVGPGTLTSPIGGTVQCANVQPALAPFLVTGAGCAAGVAPPPPLVPPSA